MPVGQPTRTTPIYSASIVTSNPATGKIEAIIAGNLENVSVITTPVAFRWPVAGETWRIKNINGIWYLDEPYPVLNPGSTAATSTTAAATVATIPAGDVALNSPTGQIHVLGSKDGVTDFVINKASLTGGGVAGAASGDLSGTYPSPTVSSMLGASSGGSFAASNTLSPAFHMPPITGGPPVCKRFMRNINQDANSRRLILFIKGRDTVNWEYSAPVEIIIRTSYQIGSYTRSLFTSGYTQAPQLTVVEAFGPRAIAPRLLGAEVTVSGTIVYQQVVVDLPQYEFISAEITYASQEVGSITNGGQIIFDGTELANTGSGIYFDSSLLVPGGMAGDMAAGVSSRRSLGTGALQAMPGNTVKTTRQYHTFTMDDQTSQNTTASIMGSFFIYPATGETVTLIGAVAHCQTLGATPSTFKVQYDHAVHGTLADVPGLTALSPTTTQTATTATGFPLALTSLDRIGLVATNAATGNSKGCTVQIVTEHTS